VLEGGRFSAPVVLDRRATFKGYLTAFESLPEGSPEVPCFFGDSPDTSTSGHVMRVAIAVSGGGDDDAPPPPPPPPGPGQLLFSDDFSRASSNSLGSNWKLSGLWLMNGQRAVSDLDNPKGDNLSLAQPSRCADCEVEARVQHFAEEEAGVVLRATGNARARPPHGDGLGPRCPLGRGTRRARHAHRRCVVR
jgi:hypothetical protein